jgi:hypothetical protein
MTARSRPFLALAIVAVLAAACGASTSPAPSSPASTPVPVATPSPVSDPSAEPSSPVTPAEPSAQPSANPSPTPEPSARPLAWSKPRVVKGMTGCFDVVGTVDDAGTSHLAASCGAGGTEIRYASSTDGKQWTVRTFKAPAGRFEQDPEIAFSGSTLYLASTRLAPEGEGCGDDGLTDVGVYVRSRSLPDGDWSGPRKIGATADHLAGLRVSDGVIHAVVTNEKSNGKFYERVDGGDLQRVRIGDISTGIGLRVGDDGVARLAFDGNANGIQYGTVTGGKVSASTVPGTAQGGSPILALGPGNTAYLLWTISAGTGGCIDLDPGSKAGTYFSTNAGGSWQTTKLSKALGAASLTMDPSSGEVDAIVGDFHALQVFVKPASGGWTHHTLTNEFASSAVVRRNPVSGGLVVAYVRDSLDGDVPAQVRVIVQE